MKLIIFDIDGTLLYATNRRDSRAFAQTYEDLYEEKFPGIDWNVYPQVTDEVIFATVFQQHFNRKPSLEEKIHFQNHYVQLLQQNRLDSPQEFKEIPNARNTVLRLLRMEGYSVGIATGGWARPAQVKLGHIGIDYQQLYCGYGDNNFTREAIIQQALDCAAEDWPSIERVVYIGDANWDVKTTHNMNIPFVGVRYKGDNEVLEALGAKHVITDYQDFEGFLDILDKALVP